MIIRGKIKGDKEVVKALNKAPHVFLRFFRAWFSDERARFLGGKDSRGRIKRGYRDIISRKRRWKRQGTWSSQVTGLFKGYITKAQKLNDLRMEAGVGLHNPKKIHQALYFLQSGGGHTSTKEMPIPFYKNLSRIGINKGFWKGKAFKWMIDKGQLVRLKPGGVAFYFLKEKRRKSGKKVGSFPRTALMFMGVHSMTARRQFINQYDFYGRWGRMQPGIAMHGRGVADRATKAVEAGRMK